MQVLLIILLAPGLKAMLTLASTMYTESSKGEYMMGE